MKSKIRHLSALLISLLPSSMLRKIAYQTFLGYQIGSGTKIGFMAVIAVDAFVCGKNGLVGRACQFQGPMRVDIGDMVSIGRWNRFECPRIAASPERKKMGYARKLLIGSKSLIHESHYFDVYGQITIGSGSWIAGRDSQFWTHGASVHDRDIQIGNDCYIGSAVRFAPGAEIGNRVIIGLGSVVAAKIAGDDIVAAGVPAKAIRHRDSQGSNLIFERLDI